MSYAARSCDDLRAGRAAGHAPSPPLSGSASSLLASIVTRSSTKPRRFCSRRLSMCLQPSAPRSRWQSCAGLLDGVLKLASGSSIQTLGRDVLL